MKIILTNNVLIEKVPEPLLKRIRDTFTIENPAWLDNHKMARWQGKTGRWLTFYYIHPGELSIPRGAMVLAAVRKSRKWRWWLPWNRGEGIVIHCRHLF
jgi:hypothetical protein